jgi:sulfate/thiosulfate transport system ATP-binding protein
MARQSCDRDGGYTMSIEVRNISKTFGTFSALKNVSMRVEHGELLALLGPSGSGKTTLLRIMAGLEQADAGSGTVLFEGEDRSDRGLGQRGVGFVFQHYALFRHMTVFENVAFGLRVRPWKTRPARKEIRNRVERLLELVQLEGLAHRFPSQLSGGQRQRVALARALAVEPKVLLLDEPFGALDAKVRQELRRWLRRLHDEMHITSVFVTHDQEEAMELADRVAVMHRGQLEQVGTPDEVFHHPASEFVMDFLGQVNLFHGRVEEGRAVFGPLVMERPGEEKGAAGRPARLLVRPHELELELHPNGKPAMAARVRRIQSAGPSVKVELAGEEGQEMTAEITHDRLKELGLSADQQVFVSPRRARVFAEDYVI